MYRSPSQRNGLENFLFTLKQNHIQNNGKYYNRLVVNVERREKKTGKKRKKVIKYKSRKNDWLAKVNSENYKKVVVFIVFSKTGDLLSIPLNLLICRKIVTLIKID